MPKLRRDLLALLILTAITIAQGFYAVKLNVDFYKVHAPFFDSCSYSNQLAIVAGKARLYGLKEGISESLSGNVALPFLEEILVTKVIPPSRIMGVWLQSVWMIALAWSLYWYFARYRQVDRWLALLLVLPFLSFERVYDWNGGLPDFRMDLSLYIFVSLTAVWYLATYETKSRWPWLFTGVAAMLACLARATAPIYLSVMLGPLYLVRLATAPQRREILAKSLWTFLPFVIGAAAFLLYNFKYLYFYYVTWNPDANRHLPWSESSRHFIMATSHVGDVLLDCALAAIAINIVCMVVRAPQRLPIPDWRPIWLALGTPLFLAFRGAGLNPFVSMPAVFGLLLFACLPFFGKQPASQFIWARATMGILLAAGASACAAAGQIHSGANTSSMPGIRVIIDRLSQDARSRGIRRIELIAPELGDFHSCMMSNVLTYEYGAMPGEAKALNAPGGVTYHFPNELTFTASEELFWAVNVAGDSEQARFSSVVKLMAAGPEYLLFPDEATLNWLEHNRSGNFINTKTREIKSRLLKLNRWVRLGEPVRVGADEQIEVFAPLDAT